MKKEDKDIMDTMMETMLANFPKHTNDVLFIIVADSDKNQLCSGMRGYNNNFEGALLQVCKQQSEIKDSVIEVAKTLIIDALIEDRENGK